jgi:hypothetical protein
MRRFLLCLILCGLATAGGNYPYPHAYRWIQGTGQFSQSLGYVEDGALYSGKNTRFTELYPGDYVTAWSNTVPRQREVIRVVRIVSDTKVVLERKPYFWTNVGFWFWGY